MKQKISKSAKLILFSFFTLLVGCDEKGTEEISVQKSLKGGLNRTLISEPEIPTDAFARREYVVQELMMNNKANTWIRQTASDKDIDYSIYVIANGRISQEFTHLTTGIRNMVKNPELHLDLQASYYSPTYIDFSSVLGNSAEEIKFRCVYNKLTESPEFKNLFVNMFMVDYDRIKPNVVFKIEDLENGVNARTRVHIYNALDNQIIINRNYLLNDKISTLEIAKTILHECIHAYLNVKFAQPNTGISIPDLQDKDVVYVIEKYYNKFIGDEAQHNFFYNYMLRSMELVLSEVKDNVVSSADSALMEKLVINIPNSDYPERPFSWREFYTNLSLIGLQNCNVFKAEIAIVSNDSNGKLIIFKTIDEIKTQKFLQYNYYGSLHLTKTCN